MYLLGFFLLNCYANKIKPGILFYKYNINIILGCHMTTEKQSITLELDPQIVEMLTEAAAEHETTVSDISNQLLHFAVDRLEASSDEDFDFEDEDEDDEDYDDEDEDFDDED